MKRLREKIGEIPIFSGLTREDLAKLLDKMEECSFSAGTIIFSQSDPGDAFYFIESGAVQVVVKGAMGNRNLLPYSDRRIGSEKWPWLPASSVPQQ